jgi:hypothetical protein
MQHVLTIPTRNSSHLAAKETATFVDMTSHAVQRKAIRESLALCSQDMKRQVKCPYLARQLSRFNTAGK